MQNYFGSTQSADPECGTSCTSNDTDSSTINCKERKGCREDLWINRLKRSLFSFFCFIDDAITVVPFSPIPLRPTPSLSPAFPQPSPCPWAVHVSSLAFHFL